MYIMENIYILYGSQYGNSKSVAESVKEMLESKSIESSIRTLNSVKNVNFKKSKLIIVSSTAGNGDPPDNAYDFWRLIKNKTIDKTYFSDVDYMVLALGDTNYSYFCQFGKNIDTRLNELGGNRLLPLHYIDDATSPEDSIDAWIELISRSL
jgi:sulfite reductase alpha subunit-like flavoprotein